ncbi:hypothetical protein ACS0TY_035716 [Phlomoides rotata]
MDKRSWPWKKKTSSDKHEKANASSGPSATASDIGATQIDKGKLDSDNKKPKYVQIPIESYTHLTGLEDQVKAYEEQVQGLEDEVNELNEKLSEAHSEITTKENLVKQHAKVAEEAVSGWEKAEAEAATLKSHLESVTLLKISAEDRGSHLDGALKECMKQIRNLKEEHALKINEVVLNKNRVFDRMKHELEAQIDNLEQELRMSASDNDAVSRSLHERSNMLVKLSEEKSKADVEIERMKSNIESYEKEVHSLKYEVHLARKEVEIRNEEKNMSVRSAEVANKQHLDGVKKIAKLEAECQRLRVLVRKKLPGPAALAQMKLEVENMGRDYGDSRPRRSRPPTTHLSLPEFSFDSSLKYQKENEILADRLLAMDEETRMLKEALVRRNGDLQTSRSICAQTACKLQSLEAQQANGEWRNPSVTNDYVHIEGFTGQRASSPPSPVVFSEDGNDDNISCAGSCTTLALSELSYIQKDKNTDTPNKSENANHLDLMDDFLEMEKLAYQTNGSNPTDQDEAPVEDSMNTDSPSRNQDALQPQVPSEKEASAASPRLQADSLIIVKLESEISRVLESMSEDKDMDKVMVDVRNVIQNMHHHSEKGVIEAAPCSDNVETVDQELEVAISNIYNFATILGKEAKAVPGASPDGDELSKSINMFTAKYTEATKSDINLHDFVLDVSYVLSKASELHFNVLGFRSSEVETNSSDCIDKIALPENKAIVDLSGKRYSDGCSHFSDSVSDPDTPGDGNLVPTSESSAPSWKCTLEEFEQLKMDKDNLATDLTSCTEKFERTQSQLLATEQLLADVKSQLASAQKSNSLAETQLKCMAESYKSLEIRADDLQTEVNLLQGKIENLDHELQEERRNHQVAVTRCNDLLEQLQRIDSREAADIDDRISQGEEIAAAAEKLAECQETIFLLGKQLKALRPQTDSPTSLNKGTNQKIEEEATMNLQDHSSEMYTATSFHLQRAGSESPSYLFNSQYSPSDSEANNNPLSSPVRSNYRIHRAAKSTSSSASSTPTPEKQARGISRFFSSKGKIPK